MNDLKRYLQDNIDDNVQIESWNRQAKQRLRLQLYGLYAFYRMSFLDNVFIVEGAFLERLINSVNFEDLDSIGFFQRVLKDKGVFEELEKMGIKDEDVVRLDEIEFEYFK